MRLSCLAAVVLATLGLDARGDVSLFDPLIQPAMSSSIELGATLQLLPPGVRAPHQAVGELAPRRGEGSSGPTLVERISTDVDEWIEVEYTIDPTLDSVVRETLKRQDIMLGHVILMDPSSGEVFSYVSTDPANFAATGIYPTASLMKVVTASAALHIAPDAAAADCRYVGSPYHVGQTQLTAPVRGGRVDSFERAIAFSNNQCFARLAIDRIGKQGLLREMHRVGLFEAPGFHHAPGRVDPIKSDLDLGLLGSGLEGSYISPLAAARLAAMLARGELVTPYWISRVRDQRGNSLAVPQRRDPIAVWSPEVADELREILLSVTTVGTARRAFHNRRGRPLLGGVGVSGKTGTLTGTDPERRYRWFIGVAPAADPQIAIAVVVATDKHSTGSASVLAAAVLREIFCEEDVCDASRSERLAERARARRAVEAREAEEATAVAALAATEATRKREEELNRTYEAHELDQIPRLVGDPQIDLPRRLLRIRARGKIVLMLELDRSGRISSAEIDSSNLPRFNDFILDKVKSWSFTPPTHGGRPVHARARLPIPIRVK